MKKTTIILSFLLSISMSIFAQVSIISRPTWDNNWNSISQIYKPKLGTQIKMVVNGKTLIRETNVVPYLNTTTLKGEKLTNVYCRVIIHHTAMTATGTAYQQFKEVRNLEISSMGYSDIAYHFIIASDGTIGEGRPCFRIGAHAGLSKETEDAFKKAFPNGLNLSSKIGDDYLNSLKKYIEILKMDPDYGSIGIALCGDFTNAPPTQAQLDALEELLNWVKTEYDIPSKNIIFHKDVKTKVVEASGYTFAGNQTVCAGASFTKKMLDEVRKKLNKDTKASKGKKLTLN